MNDNNADSTGMWVKHGAAGAETEVVGPASQLHAVTAWSDDDVPPVETPRRTWRLVAGIAAAIVVVAAIIVMLISSNATCLTPGAGR